MENLKKEIEQLNQKAQSEFAKIGGKPYSAVIPLGIAAAGLLGSSFAIATFAPVLLSAATANALVSTLTIPLMLGGIGTGIGAVVGAAGNGIFGAIELAQKAMKSPGDINFKSAFDTFFLQEG